MGARRAEITVLGHYPEYLEEARRTNARYLNISGVQWNAMNEAERWEANAKFLDETIARGDEIILATPFHRVRPGTYFERELKYLASKGYQPTPDRSRLVRKDNR